MIFWKALSSRFCLKRLRRQQRHQCCVSQTQQYVRSCVALSFDTALSSRSRVESDYLHRFLPLYLRRITMIQCRDFSVERQLESNVGQERNTERTNDILQKQQTQYQATKAARSYQQKATRFLEQVQQGRIHSSHVTQKVDELFLLCLNDIVNVPADGPLALGLLNVGLKYTDKSSQRLIPRLFSFACQMMVQSHHPRAINETEKQIWKLLDGHQQYFVRNDPAHNSFYVNDACSQLINHLVMNASKKKQKVNYRSSQVIDRLIQRLEELFANPTIPLQSEAQIENSIVMFLCHQLRPQEAYGRFRNKVESSTVNDAVPFTPTIATFCSIITGFARTKQPEKALEVVQWMLNCHKNRQLDVSSNKNNIVPSPNVACFNALLHAYAMTGAEDAGYKGEETLMWMEMLSDTMNLDTIPDKTSYNICINCWARSNHAEAPIRAEALLEKMIGLSREGYPISPSQDTYCSVMNAWVNSSHSQAIARVTTLLDMMEKLSRSDGELLTNHIPYVILIKALEKDATKKLGYKDMEIADAVLQLSSRMKTRGIAPSEETYNSILTALKQTSAINAVFYFLELEQQYRRGEIQIGTRAFNIGLNALAELNKPDAAEKATDILNRMFHYCETDPSVTPSRWTFNIILKILSRTNATDAAQKAEKLLHDMEKIESSTPDSFSYVSCIMAWGRSGKKDMFDRVLGLLSRYVDAPRYQEGKKEGAILVFNAVLSVCHHNISSKNRTKAVETALDTMQFLRHTNDAEPDNITYTTFFHILEEAKTNEDSSYQVALSKSIHEEFIKCMSHGLVTREILTSVSSVAPNVISQIIGEGKELSSFSIPRTWSRNVRRRPNQ